MLISNPKKERVVKKGVMVIKGIDVTVGTYKDRDYINLSDIVSYIDGQRHHIETWIRNKKTLDFLTVWERRYNPDFSSDGCDAYLQSLADGATSTVNRWIKAVNAIGIKTQLGRHSGGTYAHKDIAFEFATYMDAEFKLYLIEEFQRLKEKEAKRKGNVWDAKRELARVNYRAMTDVVKDNLVDGLTGKIRSIVYAAEADYLNVAVFGMSNADWKLSHPDRDGNQRDNGTVLDNILVSNLELQNAIMIKAGMGAKERQEKLMALAAWLREIYKDNPGMKRLSNKYDDPTDDED